MENWRQIQSQYIEETESVFRHIPVTRIPWFPEEIRGIDAVELLGRELPDDHVLFDPPAAPESGPDRGDARFPAAETYEITEQGYRLRLLVPGAENVTAELHGQDLDVRVGNMLRRIPLPNVLHKGTVTGTWLKDGILLVDFQV